MAVQNLPPPCDPFQIVILVQTVCPHLSEYPLGGPVLKIAVRRTARAILAGKHFPLTTCAQNIENPVQYFSWVCGRSSPWPFLTLGLGNVFLDLLPELIADISPTRPSWKRPSILLPSQSSSPPNKENVNDKSPKGLDI